MKSGDIKEQNREFLKRITGINTWIKQNPQITEPNINEMMGCNIELAEILSAYKEETGIENLKTCTTIHTELIPSYNAVLEMDVLRDVYNHQFFENSAARELYLAIKDSILQMSYEIPDTEEMTKLKRELLARTMSVAFFIDTEKRSNEDFKYNNIFEYYALEGMFSAYQRSGNMQFSEQIQKVMDSISNNYQYAPSENKINK